MSPGGGYSKMEVPAGGLAKSPSNGFFARYEASAGVKEETVFHVLSGGFMKAFH